MVAMSRSPDAELAILLELLSAQEALDEHRRRMASKSVATAQRQDDRQTEAEPSQADALTAIEQALIKANANIESP
jgi:hypothetical protein